MLVTGGVLSGAVAMAWLMVQALASGFFPGSRRGFNLPVSVVSFIAWAYKGLLRNEFVYRAAKGWGCPGANIVPALPEVALTSWSLDPWSHRLLARFPGLQTLSSSLGS